MAMYEQLAMCSTGDFYENTAEFENGNRLISLSVTNHLPTYEI